MLVIVKRHIIYMKQLNKIPIGLKIRMLFSSKLIFTGLFLLLVPTIILVGFLPNIDFHDSKYKEKPINKTKGVVLSVWETNSSINGEKALGFNYNFYLDNETISGQSFGFEDSFSVGDTVNIEYITTDTSISRIVGTNNGAFDVSTLEFILGFVIFGLIVLIIPIYIKVKTLKILSSGFEILPSKLELELKTPTLPIGKSNPFYQLKFNYDISGYTYSKVIYTSRDEFSMSRIRMSSIIVDSHNHSRAFILETLPTKIKDYIVEKSTIANEKHT